MSYSTDENWLILSSLEQSIKAKIEAVGTPLSQWGLNINRGLLTGLNDAFIISAEKREELIKEDPMSAEIIRPILRGRDIKRYGYQFAELYLIVSHNGNKKNKIPRINIDEYPAIKRHLSLFGEKLIKRADQGDTPFNLRNCVYMDDFSKQKIVWGNLCLSAQFALAEEDIYINAPSPMIVPGNKYILAILNSKVGDWYIRQLGVTRNGGYFEYKPMFVEKLPIPLIPNEKQAPFIALVDQILSCKAEARDTHDLEQKLDELAFDLYNLTKEEIDYILQA
ncbi:MAG: hypothetical protein IJX67_07010 [Oscillospiraceae bacterium]|nr:hypothetical protein [Oscillospiraceae bacterium]